MIHELEMRVWNESTGSLGLSISLSRFFYVITRVSFIVIVSSFFFTFPDLLRNFVRKTKRKKLLFLNLLCPKLNRNRWNPSKFRQQTTTRVSGIDFYPTIRECHAATTEVILRGNTTCLLHQMSINKKKKKIKHCQLVGEVKDIALGAEDFEFDFRPGFIEHGVANAATMLSKVLARSHGD